MVAIFCPEAGIPLNEISEDNSGDYTIVGEMDDPSNPEIRTYS